MSDEIILYKFLKYELTDDHPAVYLYCVGQKKSKTTAINNSVKIVSDLFCPPYTIEFIKKIVINFLEYKKMEYLNGEIEITPIYC
jgi:DNA-dependent RNA polymerase auxiliary subunit epsilon